MITGRESARKRGREKLTCTWRETHSGLSGATSLFVLRDWSRQLGLSSGLLHYLFSRTILWETFLKIHQQPLRVISQHIPITAIFFDWQRQDMINIPSHVAFPLWRIHCRSSKVSLSSTGIPSFSSINTFSSAPRCLPLLYTLQKSRIRIHLHEKS